MERKIICYFENEAQCEAAVTALCSANINANDMRIVTDSTQKTDGLKNKNYATIGSSASFALPEDYQNNISTQTQNYLQAPIATLLIRGDLFTFTEKESREIGSFAVEVRGNQETLDLARDILLNLF